MSNHYCELANHTVIDIHKEVTISACQTHCNDHPECKFIQMQCGTECWLLSDCGTPTPSNCGTYVTQPRDGTFSFRFYVMKAPSK